ncbi:hypothetical protein PHMEG_00039280 [Phytophthora megakarya]|uniref:Uncharacterized protein n=1 Tax=Phytophthora megakarya TaxID=4795 RepID=A0A225UFX0_9STRA|nr:hypothetical protein PHMEG_00039280 [Phytophthora megakarya]
MLIASSPRKKEHLLFRIRSSETAAKHNSRAGATQIPAKMTHSWKRLWCTHGSGQASRSEGRRNRGSRYTGCEAGFMVRSESIVEDGQAKWVVRVVPGTEISKHNHPTNKIVYESYSAPTSQVLSLPVYRELGLLQDMKTSSADVNRYLSDKLGGFDNRSVMLITFNITDLDMILTPQQTRNILQQVLGTTILERTKRILDSFAEEDVGNDVLIVQVQMDITYIIAIRTAIPKTCFLEWVMPS